MAVLAPVTRHRTQIRNTKYGDLNVWVRDVDRGYVAFLDPTEYPEIPVAQAPAGEALPETIEEAVEQLRRAINAS